MRPAARLQALVDALATIYTTPKPADSVLSAYFRNRRYIGSKDRAAIAESVYAALRHHARIGWWLQRVGLPEDARTSALCWYMLNGVRFEELDVLCSGGEYAPDKLNSDEKSRFAKLEGRSKEHPEMPEAVRLEVPEWAEEKLRERFGKRFEAEMVALLDAAPLDLRVNTLKVDRDTAMRELRAERIEVEPTPLSPLGLRVKGRPALAMTKAFKAGMIEIQDEGSQMLAMLMDAKPGDQVVDFCAGAGGKTLAIAAQMHNKGRIIACDVLERRLERAAERFRRAGVHNIETRALTTERDPWVKRHKGKFDRVLVDAPCSGIGVWRRNPDARWRVLGPGLGELVKLQGEILNSAARLVKPGGRLVYATCSMLAEENAQRVEIFLNNNPDFILVPYGQDGGRYLELTPGQHNTDGFFGAVMVRKTEEAGAPEADAAKDSEAA